MQEEYIVFFIKTIQIQPNLQKFIKNPSIGFPLIYRHKFGFSTQEARDRRLSGINGPGYKKMMPNKAPAITIKTGCIFFTRKSRTSAII